MTMAKAKRKEFYRDIQALMLKGENKAAFEKLTMMAADDVQVYCLTDQRVAKALIDRYTKPYIDTAN